MKRTLDRLLRRLIRAQLRKSSSTKLIAIGERKLIPAFRRAARHSPAYRTLLAEAGVDADRITSAAEFSARCPLLDKANTFRRFPVGDLLAEDVRPDDLASVLTSSGHGSGGYALGLSTRLQVKRTPFDIDLGLDIAFDIDRRRTLLINCLPMGVTFQSNAVCVANVSVREDMACAIVEQAGRMFEQIILCGDPLFLKRLCDYSQPKGVDWRAHRMNCILGEETFTESYRDYLGSVLGIDPDDSASGLVGSSMGVGELGLNIFNETRETIALRRACARDPALRQRLLGPAPATSAVPTFMVYNCMRSYVEIIDADADGNGDLVVTMLDPTIPVPLMRYKTGDRACIVPAERLAAEGAAIGGGFSVPALPVIALHGRAKDELGGGLHVDAFKDALYRDHEIARECSGAFRLSRCESGGGAFHWEVQLRRGSTADAPTWAQHLQDGTAHSDGGPLIAVTCWGYDDFPYGRTLDYERKFVYWPG